MPGPVFPCAVRATAGASTISASILAALGTWMTANIASSRFGRALVAIRDAEVAAEAIGIAKPKLLMLVFLFGGAHGRRRGRPVRVAAVLHHARRLHLRAVGAVLHRHPDRRARLDPRAAARHHHADGAARIRRAAGGMVDLPLRGAAAGDRAGDPGRHRRPARLQEPPAAASSDRAIVPRPELLAQLLDAAAQAAAAHARGRRAAASAACAPSTGSTSRSARARCTA